MKKNLIAAVLVLGMLLSCFAACGKKEPARNETEPAVSDEPLTEETAPVEDKTAEEDTTAGKVDLPRPVGDGQLVEAYDLTFYLPSDMTANEWNGMLGVYEYYTGENTSGIPSGMDITLSATAASNVDGELADYAKNTSSSSRGLTAEPETVSFNGFDWLRISADGAVDYYAVFNEGLYEIVAKRGGASQEDFDAAIAMMEDTLCLRADGD